MINNIRSIVGEPSQPTLPARIYWYRLLSPQRIANTIACPPLNHPISVFCIPKDVCIIYPWKSAIKFHRCRLDSMWVERRRCQLCGAASRILELYITHPIPYTLLSIQENMRQGGISSTIECVPHYKGSSSSGYFTILLVPVPAPASLIALHYAIIVAHPRHSPTIVL